MQPPTHSNLKACHPLGWLSRTLVFTARPLQVPLVHSRHRHRQVPILAAREPLSPAVEQLLKTHGLEAPEGSTPLHMLQVTEAYWKAMRDPVIAAKPAATVVRRSEGNLSSPPQYDVCIVGGTLGIFAALALQMRGHKVCVLEKRMLQGRSQEWNIASSEMESLVQQGLISTEELQKCIVTSWKKDRLGFKDGEEVWVEGVLDVGVSPRRLIAALYRRFLEAGGIVLEQTSFKSAVIYDDGALIKTASMAGGEADTLGPGDVNRPTAVAAEKSHPPGRQQHITARILIDCMGHYSPIVKQVRGTQQPDGMVVVVGGCFTSPRLDSSTNNATADLLYTFTDAFDDTQLFWEAFPAEGGNARTVYCFQYSDTAPTRPTFAQMMDTFLKLLPQYQGLELSDISFKRVLFGGFPCYIRGSPLGPSIDRVVQIGDAAASQSPLSFGGFGAMIRHLPRLTRVLDDSLRENLLSAQDLHWVQPYQPSLSVAWLFQRCMSVKAGQLRWLPVDHVNRLMRCNFSVLTSLGQKVLKPFVADSMQFGPLAATMLGMMLSDPVVVTRVLFQVGPGLIIGWLRHYLALAAFTVAYLVLRPFRGLFKGFAFQRLLDTLEYGSGLDYRSVPGRSEQETRLEPENKMADGTDQGVPRGTANGGSRDGTQEAGQPSSLCTA